MSVEQRITELEKALSFYKGAFWILGFILLAAAGVGNFVLIPNAALKALNSVVTKETREKIDAAAEAAERLVSGTPVVYDALADGTSEKKTSTERNVETAKHSYCALSEILFNHAEFNGNKVCKVSKRSDGTWLLNATAEPYQTMVCQAVCFP